MTQNVLNNPGVSPQIPSQLVRAQNWHKKHLGLLQMTHSLLELAQTSPPLHPLHKGSGPTLYLSIDPLSRNNTVRAQRIDIMNHRLKNFNQCIQKGYSHFSCPHLVTTKVYYDLKFVNM